MLYPLSTRRNRRRLLLCEQQQNLQLFISIYFQAQAFFSRRPWQPFFSKSGFYQTWEIGLGMKGGERDSPEMKEKAIHFSTFSLSPFFSLGTGGMKGAREKGLGLDNSLSLYSQKPDGFPALIKAASFQLWILGLASRSQLSAYKERKITKQTFALLSSGPT